MRKAGLGLALVASAQLTLLSTPAFADDTKASVAPTEDPSSSSVSVSSGGSSGGSSSSNAERQKTGWIIFGIGGAATLTGLVLDIVGTAQPSPSGQGGQGDPGTTQNARTNFYWGGTALIVAGVVTGIVGGSMIWAKPAPPTGRDHSSDEAQVDNVTKTAAAAAQSTPGFTIPVVGATF
jgi:hypothetical protein